jgi:hypothetical protein
VGSRNGAGSRQREDADETRKDTFGKGVPSKPNQNPPQARTNHRSLDAIANDIHALGRTNVFAEGDLLLEAKETCDHGDWDGFLESNGWSWDSASRRMEVAKLGTKFRKLRVLKLAKTTLYSLADLAEEDENLLPAIIDALAKHATKVQLKPAIAEDVIRLVQLRQEHGNLPDATLRAFDMWCEPGFEASDEIAAALKKQKPTTKEEAEKIVAAITAKVKARLDAAAAATRDPAYEQWLDSPHRRTTPPAPSSDDSEPDDPDEDDRAGDPLDTARDIRNDLDQTHAAIALWVRKLIKVDPGLARELNDLAPDAPGWLFEELRAALTELDTVQADASNDPQRWKES